jgi:hypothetical protein
LSEDVDTSTTTESASMEQSVDQESGNHVESEATDTFKPIGSQAEFDAALKQRLARAEKSAEKKFTTRVAELEDIVHQFENEKLSEDEKRDKRLQELTAALAERDDALKGHERSKLVSTLADDLGLPRKYHDRIRGDSEEDITADIQDFLEGLPKPDAKVRQSGTVKVQSTGDQGEPEITADSIFKNLPPHLR